jgi:2-alkyl-3-oxoalkanoate reductase
MNVFVAGATGAIGARLVPMLVRAGHRVTGTTHQPARARRIQAAGASPVVMDGLDRTAVLEAVRQANPDVIIHQLTAIPARFNLRRLEEEFAATNRLRIEGTDALLAAARAVGCKRFIAQSYTGWPNDRTGGWVKTEDDPLVADPEPALRGTLQAIQHVETAVLGGRALEGFVLRYGSFYGPGTSLGPGGSFLEDIRKRRVPIVGAGSGYWSFIHIDDAASATLAAVQASTPGLYNIVDDEPAPVSEWLPLLAEALDAKPPRRIPEWVGRIAIGAHGVAMMTRIRGASNRKAKQLLGWRLRWPSWRQGFREGMTAMAEPTVEATRRG